MAGYSSTPLAKKLGIKPGHRVLLQQPPESLQKALLPLPEGVSVTDDIAPEGDYDVIVLFAEEAAELEADMAFISRRLTPAGGLWIGWPKKASKVPTDLSFDVVQRFGLELGLVDNKICAISDIYSGLRFVVRKEDRDAWAKGKRQLTP